MRWEEFVISQNVLNDLEDRGKIKNFIKSGKNLQELFGFSTDAMVQFYEAAKDILEQRRFEDAISAFTFLTFLNQNVADFWKGLGLAQQNNNNYEEAIGSFTTMVHLESNIIAPYMLAALCHADRNRYDEAIEVVDSAESYAINNLEGEESKRLRGDALAAKQYFKDRKGR